MIFRFSLFFFADRYVARDDVDVLDRKGQPHFFVFDGEKFGVYSLDRNVVLLALATRFLDVDSNGLFSFVQRGDLLFQIGDRTRFNVIRLLHILPVRLDFVPIF